MNLLKNQETDFLPYDSQFNYPGKITWENKVYKEPLPSGQLSRTRSGVIFGETEHTVKRLVPDQESVTRFAFAPKKPSAPLLPIKPPPSNSSKHPVYSASVRKRLRGERFTVHVPLEERSRTRRGITYGKSTYVIDCFASGSIGKQSRKFSKPRRLSFSNCE